jgi:hypothetical protein
MRKELNNEYIKYSIIKIEDKIYKCEYNNLYMNLNDNYYYIYHTFDSYIDNFFGRWYNTNITLKSFQWDFLNYIIIYYIPEWEIDYPKYYVIKDVPIYIYFTEEGFRKFKKYIKR